MHVQLRPAAVLGARAPRAVVVHPLGAVPGLVVPHVLGTTLGTPLQIGVAMQLVQLWLQVGTMHGVGQVAW